MVCLSTKAETVKISIKKEDFIVIKQYLIKHYTLGSVLNFLSNMIWFVLKFLNAQNSHSTILLLQIKIDHQIDF